MLSRMQPRCGLASAGKGDAVYEEADDSAGLKLSTAVQTTVE